MGKVGILNTGDTDEAHNENRRIEAVFSISHKRVLEQPSGIAQAQVSIVVHKVNKLPVAVNDKATLNENESVDITVLNNDFDGDGDQLTVTTYSAQHGRVEMLANGVARYTPEHGFYGSDVIQYAIDDGQGGVAEAIVDITINYVAKPWYLWGDVAYARGTTTKSDLDNDYQSSGLNASTISLDTSRLAAQLGLGYRFKNAWAVEAGYVDLGEVEMTLSASAQDLQQIYAGVAKIHPLSAKGFVVAGQYHWSVKENTEIFARLGFWHWQAKYKTVQGVKVGDDSDKGNDFVLGLGAMMGITQDISARLSWQRYLLDGDAVDLAAVGVVYKLN